MIMRQGSNLEEIKLTSDDIDLTRFSIFTTYNPGISNLKSLVFGNPSCQNIMEFLSMVPKLCNRIIDCELYCPDNASIKVSLNIIKSQPLERMLFFECHVDESIKNALGFRTENLKELLFHYISFLCIKFYSGQSLNQIIPLICKLSTLKILNIEAVVSVQTWIVNG